MNVNPAHFRKPLVLLGMIGLLAGLWAGVVRIGWAWPVPRPDFVLLHGALMVGGFLGTVIGLERAVALKTWWGYLSPLSAAVSVVALLAGVPAAVPPGLLLFSGVILLAMFGVFIARQPSLSTFTMLAGTLTWCGSTVLWLRGAPLFMVVYWWIGFLVLTIAGERILLSQIVTRSRSSTATFVSGNALVALAVVLSGLRPDVSARVLGVGLIVVGSWVLRYDIARKTVKQSGLTRFIAVCLLSGALWLAVAGVLFLVNGHQLAGVYYDAALHAVFLGFVFSMIFGHAPLVFPAVLNVRMAYMPLFYVHLVVLHLSLALRAAGDLTGWIDGRRIGGLLGVAAILLFLLNTVFSVIYARRTTA